jgi:hypothetical protein
MQIIDAYHHFSSSLSPSFISSQSNKITNDIEIVMLLYHTNLYKKRIILIIKNKMREIID